MTLTETVILLVVAALVVFDVWLVAKVPGQTISEVLNRAALKRPIIPFGVGVLCGHWFWPL